MFYNILYYRKYITFYNEWYIFYNFQSCFEADLLKYHLHFIFKVNSFSIYCFI